MALARSKKVFMQLLPFFVFQYVSNALYGNNMPNYLRSISISDRDIGSIMAILPIAGMLGQVVFGRLGDRVRHKRTLLAVLSGMSALCILLVGRFSTFATLAASMSVYCFFQLSSEPLMTTIALESTEEAGMSFGPIRAVGTISFAIASPIAGMLIANDYGRVIYLVFIALALTALAGLVMPPVGGHAHHASAHRIASPKELLHFPALWILTAFCFVLMVSMGIFNTYYSLYMTSAAIGGTSTILGWAGFLSAIMELPFLFFSNRLLKRFGAVKLIASMAVLHVLRMVAVAAAASPYALLATQIFHGWGYVVMSFCMAKYVHRIVPAQLRATGQMAFSLIALTLARAVGSFLGGRLSGVMPLRYVFLVAGAIAAVALIAFLIAVARMPILRQEGDAAVLN